MVCDGSIIIIIIIIIIIMIVKAIKNSFLKITF
jgi:hypothetical protein